MVSRRHTVSEIERSALNAASDLLQIKQEELAEVAGVSQAWLSITLSGKRPKRDVDNLTRLAQALLRLLAEKRTSDEIDVNQIDELTRPLERLSVLSKQQGQYFVSAPGRAVPSDALNYVPRALDSMIDDCLDGGDLSMYIVGPFQAGKTSLLLRLRDEAKKRGFETAYFSCTSLAKPRFFSDSTSVFRLRPRLSEEEANREVESFFRALKDTLATAWGLNPSSQLDEADFPTWAEKVLKFGPNHRGLVILDDLGYLSPLLRHRINQSIRIVKNTNSFVSFARGLVEPAPIILEGKKEIGRVEPAIILSSLSPTTSISLFPSNVPAISSSSKIYGGSPFDWWFTKEQLRDLMMRLEIDLGDDFENLYELYGGQPFFSHLVAVNACAELKKKNTAFTDYVKESEVQWPAFEQHMNLIRVTLVEATFKLAFEGENLIERLTLTDFLQKLKDFYPCLMKVIGLGSPATSSIEPSDLLKSFLIARKIIRVGDRNESQPSCGWYREIALRLGHEIESNQIELRFED